MSKTTPLVVVFVALLSGAASAEPSREAEDAHKEGLRLTKDGQTREGIAQLERSVSLDPNYAEAWADLGNARLAQGDLQNAIKALDNAVRLRPELQVARYNLAYSLRKTKNYRRAVEEYRTYLDRDPQDADAEYGLAESLKALGVNAEAAEAYETYARIEKRPGQAKWIQKAKSEAEALRASVAPESQPRPEVQEVKPAKKTQAAAPAHASKRPDTFTSGLTCLQKNDFAGALPRLLAAAHDAPDDAIVLSALAGAYLGLREGAKAEDAYRRALKNASKDALPAIEFGIAESLREQGDKTAALAEYDRVASIDGAPESIKRAAKERAAKLR